MPDAFMPDVQVDIAFNAGYTTPAASRTWTDVSSYVELAQGIDITFGRQDERSVADANQLTLTLDNSDGRFTAFRSASPYYPNVKVGRPIRVRVTPPGGTTVTRFVGFIDEWPVEWEGSDRYAMAKIRATSRLARLGLSTSLHSMPEEAILASGPAGYWTLGDPVGSTAALDSSGRGAASLAVTQGGGGSTDTGLPVVFGSQNGPATDDLTSVDFASGYVLQGYVPGPVRALHVTMRIGSLPSTSVAILAYGTLTLLLQASGTLRANLATGGAGAIITSSSFADGLNHDIVLTYTPSGTCSLYVDGILQGTATGGSSDPSPANLRVGAGFTGTLSHIAVYDTSSLTPDAAAIAGAVTGAPQRTDTRFLQITEWAGIPSTEVSTQFGAEFMSWQKTSGASIVESLRDVESTEGGVMFDSQDGTLTFHGRSNRYVKATSATLNMATQQVESDYAPKLDRSSLVNDVTATNSALGTSQRLVDSASVSEYGVASTSITTFVLDSDALMQRAAWSLASYADPRIRVPSLTVDVLAHQGLTPSAQTLLGLTVGDVVGVSNAPAQADSTSALYFTEGYRESIGAESYRITFNLSPTYPTLSTFVLDSSTRGVLDTNLIAF